VFVDVYLWAVPAGAINDPWLRDPTQIAPVPVPRDDRPRTPIRKGPPPRSIVAETLYGDLIGRYGPAEGRRIYFEMEDARVGPFAPGNKYDAARRRVPKGPEPDGDRAPLVHIEVPAARRS
jgi:hypothetical protein